MSCSSQVRSTVRLGLGVDWWNKRLVDIVREGMIGSRGGRLIIAEGALVLVEGIVWVLSLAGHGQEVQCTLMTHGTALGSKHDRQAADGAGDECVYMYVCSNSDAVVEPRGRTRQYPVDCLRTGSYCTGPSM